jgi:hypothetical protein
MASTTDRPAIGAHSIPELAFAVEGVDSVEYAAVPTLQFRLGIESLGGEPIRSILLDVQIQIAARRRAYDAAAEERLVELFGTAERWGDTLRTLLWTRETIVVPPFTDKTAVDLPVTCTYDLEVAASRYLDALKDGTVPLEFLFSGSVFFANREGGLHTTRIPWSQEAEFAMPAEAWREVMNRHFPDSAWLRLGKGAFDRLHAYKARNSLRNWDETLDSLLDDRDDG